MSKITSYMTVLAGTIGILTAPLNAADPNPYQFSVYGISGLGNSTSDTFSGNVSGLEGSGGNIFNAPTTNVNSLGVSSNYSVYAGGTYYQGSGSVFNGGVTAAGNITSNTSTIWGNVTGGGNFTGLSGSIKNNLTIAGTKTGSVTVIGTTTTGQPYVAPLNFSAVASYFQSASSYWGAQAATGTVTNNFGTLQVSNLVAGRNIVNLTLAQINSAFTIALNGPSTAFVIFNITDATPTVQNINALSLNLSGGITSAGVLFNLPNATSLSISTFSTPSILAPNATIKLTGGVNGSLIANNISGNGLVQGNVFTGFQLDQANFVAVPEPSTLALMLGMVGLAIFLKKNQKLLKV